MYSVLNRVIRINSKEVLILGLIDVVSETINGIRDTLFIGGDYAYKAGQVPVF